MQWEALLRVSPVVTPLGHPDSLVHLIDWSLDEIFSKLTNPLPPLAAEEPGVIRDVMCSCGRNPFIAYFDAGRQAMQESLVLVQAAMAPIDPELRDGSLRELGEVLRAISRQEIESFCGVCQFRSSEMPGVDLHESALSVH